MITPMNKIPPLDLAELLQEDGYELDLETGEVYTRDNEWLLMLLASAGNLRVKRNHHHELGYYIPHWKAFDSLEDYCNEFPHEQQCKCYEL